MKPEKNSETNYQEENQRRKKAVERENDFLKNELMDNEDQPVEDISPENRKTEIENKKRVGERN